MVKILSVMDSIQTSTRHLYMYLQYVQRFRSEKNHPINFMPANSSSTFEPVFREEALRNDVTVCKRGGGKMNIMQVRPGST